MPNKSDIPKHVDLMARAVLLVFATGLGSLAYYLYADGPGIGFFASSLLALVFLAIATVAPRGLRAGIVSALPPWF